MTLVFKYLFTSFFKELQNCSLSQIAKNYKMTKVTVLDGGFSTQLQNYVEDQIDGDPLWTAKYLKLQPNKCALVHRDFVMGKVK